MSHWHYYNHALLPNCPPPRENLEEAIFAELSDRQLWNENGNKALLARWTTNFDCGYETNWWYCIKDESYNNPTLCNIAYVHWISNHFVFQHEFLQVFFTLKIMLSAAPFIHIFSHAHMNKHRSRVCEFCPCKLHPNP